LPGGSSKNTDGVFGAGSANRIKDITDGTTHTAMVSESTLGQGRPQDHGYAVPRPAVVNGQTTYVSIPFPSLGPLTDSACQSATNINYVDFRGGQWAAGEPRSSSYNHYYGPNSETPDCTGIDFDFSDLAWKTARSYHPGGVNIALCDASVRFLSDRITLATWRALATREGGEVVSADF
jgi:prepilin-type processing-associated H-X9-DG protein